MTQETVTQTQPQGLAVAETKAISGTNKVAREIASRLKFMIVNGSKLADPEVFALAQYSAANDLNPFAGECYYLPGTGPVPGIAGWRKKAQEQLQWECDRAGLKEGGHIWFDYESLDTLGEASFDPKKGDVAEVVILHDWLSNHRWRRALFETMRELRDMGVPNPYEEARAIVGPEPTWSAIGVVYGVEAFAAAGKPEKFNRHERARKRGEKLALRKRFPRVNLPEPDEYNDAQDFQVIPDPSEARDKPRAKSELLSGMGFDEPATSGQGTRAGEFEPIGERAPDALRAYLLEEAKEGGAPDSKAFQEANGCLDYILRSKDARMEFLTWLNGSPVKSSKDLQPGLFMALHRYLDPAYDTNGTVYYPQNQAALAEVPAAHASSLKATGQQSLI